MFLVSSSTLAKHTISHEKLLYKLDKYGIRGNAHSLIGSYLSNRKQYVSVLGESSDELPVAGYFTLFGSRGAFCGVIALFEAFYMFRDHNHVKMKF